MGTAQPQSVALTGTRSRIGARRQLGHVLVGIAGWVALAGLWVWQLSNYIPANWLTGIELIFALLIGWTFFSVAWVAWCRNIYRRRHRRTAPIEREVDFSHDTLGRPILAAPAVRGSHGQVLLWVDSSNVKHYQLVARDPHENAPPPRTTHRRHTSLRRGRLPA
jgi:hypothetical protein